MGSFTHSKVAIVDVGSDCALIFRSIPILIYDSQNESQDVLNALQEAAEALARVHETDVVRLMVNPESLTKEWDWDDVIETIYKEAAKPAPDFGDVFTIEEFSENCVWGRFIPSDGHGSYAFESHKEDTPQMMEMPFSVDCWELGQKGDHPIHPPEWATHVI